MSYRKNAAWAEIGRRHPISVSLFFSRSSVAYRSAQVELGRSYPFLTVGAAPLGWVLVLLGGGLAVFRWGLPSVSFSVPSLPWWVWGGFAAAVFLTILWKGYVFGRDRFYWGW